MIYLFVSRYGAMDNTLLEFVIVELSPLLNEGDLHCAQQALQLLTSLALYQPQALERAATFCMPAIKVLVRSSLLQGKMPCFELSYTQLDLVMKRK
jgi:hypothetical protein